MSFVYAARVGASAEQNTCRLQTIVTHIIRIMLALAIA